MGFLGILAEVPPVLDFGFRWVSVVFEVLGGFWGLEVSGVWGVGGLFGVM